MYGSDPPVRKAGGSGATTVACDAGNGLPFGFFLVLESQQPANGTEDGVSVDKEPPARWGFHSVVLYFF